IVVNVVESFLRLKRAAESTSLQVNGNNTKYIFSTPKHNSIEPTMGSYNIEIVKNFVTSDFRKRRVENKNNQELKQLYPKSRRCPKDQI
uniref:Uncharacterized protein n=1 Tax=Megaselia scalaris TaxID=36166 RepID=T1H0X6_MEGSC